MTGVAKRHFGNPVEVFGTFLGLGLTAFGGPIAHLGYFRTAFVVRRQWLDEAGFAELVALCQLLPGPASSQLGFLIGLARAGPLGALAAWAGFTLPSALLMLALSLALAATSFNGPLVLAAVHGLKLVAVVMVAQAVVGMAQRLAPDHQRVTIAVIAVAIVAVSGTSAGQMGALLLGGIAGLWLCRPNSPAVAIGLPLAVSRRVGVICLASFGGLLVALPILAAASGADSLRLFDIFYRAGALVFGGGHVVLPLLRADLVPEWLSDSRFLLGYGAAQALPGPLFAVAADLGAATGAGTTGGLVALIAIFLPGLLVAVGILPFWASFRANPRMTAAISGANAAVVGILGWALYDPLWKTAVESWRDIALIGLGLAALMRWRVAPVAVVAGLVLASIAISTA